MTRNIDFTQMKNLKRKKEITFKIEKGVETIINLVQAEDAEET